MAAVASRNQRLSSERSLTAPGAARLADQFCRDRRRKIGALFWSLWRNDDDLKRRVGREIAEGHASWLEAGILGLGVTVDALRPAGAAAAEPPAVDAPPPETVLPDDAVHAHSPAGSSR
jgi:hypothetical protein